MLRPARAAARARLLRSNKHIIREDNLIYIIVALAPQIIILSPDYLHIRLFTTHRFFKFISSRACYNYCHGRGLVERALTHVVLKAVSGGFLAQDPANTKYIACIVDVSYEWSFLGGPRGRLGVSLDF